MNGSFKTRIQLSSAFDRVVFIAQHSALSAAHHQSSRVITKLNCSSEQSPSYDRPREKFYENEANKSKSAAGCSRCADCRVLVRVEETTRAVEAQEDKSEDESAHEAAKVEEPEANALRDARNIAAQLRYTSTVPTGLRHRHPDGHRGSPPRLHSTAQRRWRRLRILQPRG